MAAAPLLSVRGLEKHYPVRSGAFGRETGRIRAVDGIDLDVRAGETFGLIGETGCGKSTAARTLLRLEEPTAGTVTFDGEPVTAFGPTALKRFRRRAQMIFQDPTASFDPRMRVGESVAEPLRAHGLRDAEERAALVETMLGRVGLTPGTAEQYPHELSGGQKQRAALARALVVNPELLVADEPVSALDVSVQAEILALLEELQAAFDLAVLLITHDMNVVREVCDRVAVMYLGEVVEVGPTEALLADPQHPYTRALVGSIPSLDPDRRGDRRTLSGDVPDPSDPPAGCRFHTRCPEVIPPADTDLDQAAWRGLLDLRLALESGELSIETYRRRGEDVAAELRAAFGLPTALSDPEAEATLDGALEAAAAGDLEAAAAELRAAFGTVCERRSPALETGTGTHPAACHLTDPDRGEHGD